MKEIHNAQIKKAELSGWNDGYSMLTYCLTLEMDNGFSLGYGVHNLGGVGQQSYAAEDLLRLMEVAEVKDWCELEGRYVRVEFESEGLGTEVKNKRLGHITKDIWHDVSKIYRKESTTPALDKCKEAGYEQCTDGTCACIDCEHSRVAEYGGGAIKYVCDELNIQTYRFAWCKHFKSRKEGVSNESICRD